MRITEGLMHLLFPHKYVIIALLEMLMKTSGQVMKTAVIALVMLVFFAFACSRKRSPSGPVNNPAPSPQLTVTAPVATLVAIDNFESGQINTNLLGGAWASWIGGTSAGSKAVISPGAGGSGHAGELYGDVSGTAATWPNINMSTYFNFNSTALDMRNTTGIRLYMKGQKGAGTPVDFTITLLSLNISDYSYWTYTWTPAADWTQVDIPWSSFQKPLWGQGMGMTLGAVLQNMNGIEWVISSNGAQAVSVNNEWSLDDINIYTIATPTGTPGGPVSTATPTFTSTPTVQIEADNADIQYYGRWDRTDPKNPRASWGPVYIKAKFQGTTIKIRMTDEQAPLGTAGVGNYYQYSIDGGAMTGMPSSSANEYTLASGLPDAEHTAAFYRRSECKYGKTTFSGFNLDPGKTLVPPDPRPSRKIEVLGDSIGAGLACENTGAYDNVSGNGYMSFGPLLARMVNAEWGVEARGGGAFYSDTALPMRNYFLKALGPANMENTPSPDNPDWDFNSWKPDVFILELGTNDWGTALQHEDQSAYIAKYKAFLTLLRGYYPGAVILCMEPFKETDTGGCPGPGGSCAGYEWDEARAYIAAAVSQMADPGIRAVDLTGVLVHPDDYVNGDIFHPNVQGHGKIAQYLYTNHIQPVLGW